MSYLYSISMIVISLAILGAVLASYHTLYESVCLDANTPRHKVITQKFPSSADVDRFHDSHRQEVRRKLANWLLIYRNCFAKTVTHTGVGKNHPLPAAKASDHV